jgi:hypothetical protein
MAGKDDAGKCWANSVLSFYFVHLKFHENPKSSTLSYFETNLKCWRRILEKSWNFLDATPDFSGALTKWASRGKCARDTHLALHSSGTCKPWQPWVGRLGAIEDLAFRFPWIIWKFP